MTKADDLTALAARCEAAAGADRELDAAIVIAMGGYTTTWDPRDPDQVCEIPRHTASLDAAMTLVPGGEFWMIEGRASRGYSADVGEVQDCIAHTPALALTAAALRARAHSDGGKA